jgi:flagellar assembly protein FliH
MNSSSERVSRGTVLRGEAATRAVQAALVELVSMPSPAPGQHADGSAADAAAEQGYRDGYEAGLAEARRIEAARIDELRVAAGAMARAADGLTVSQADAMARVEAMIPEIAFELTELLLGRELAVTRDPGRDAIARALALTPDNSGPVTIRLNPRDAELVGDLGDIAGGRPLSIVADAQIGPGDCIAEADSARIDATLAAALDRVRKALLT